MLPTNTRAVSPRASPGAGRALACPCRRLACAWRWQKSWRRRGACRNAQRQRRRESHRSYRCRLCRHTRCMAHRRWHRRPRARRAATAPPDFRPVPVLRRHLRCCGAQPAGAARCRPRHLLSIHWRRALLSRVIHHPGEWTRRSIPLFRRRLLRLFPRRPSSRVILNLRQCLRRHLRRRHRRLLRRHWRLRAARRTRRRAYRRQRAKRATGGARAGRLSTCMRGGSRIAAPTLSRRLAGSTRYSTLLPSGLVAAS